MPPVQQNTIRLLTENNTIFINYSNSYLYAITNIVLKTIDSGVIYNDYSLKLA